MSKFSVKKPLTIFVAVIAVLVLGVVSYLKMTPDLLPNMDFPYVVIMTTYPGASPEKVEGEITKPLEQSMSTLEHIKEVTSTSSENYSMVMLEFEEDVNMDTIGVDIQQNISTISSEWEETVGTPYVLKINPSMLPVAIAGVSMEGMDTIELTDFLNETLMNKLEGIAGVARITSEGMIQQELHVVLEQEKLDALNEEIAAVINGELDAAAEDLEEKKQELEEAQEQVETAQEELEAGRETLAQQTAAGEAELSFQQAELVSTKSELQGQIYQLQSAKTQLQTTLDVIGTLQSGLTELESQYAALQTEQELLTNLLATKNELAAKRQAYQLQIETIQNNPLLTQEEIDAAVAEILNSEDYLQTETAWAEMEAQLAARGLTPDDLETRVGELAVLMAGLETSIAETNALLAEYGLDPASINAQIADMEAQMTQIDDGIAALETAIVQLDDGLLQIKDAAALLSAQKTSGLLEISSAATELAVNGASLTEALMQIEGGLTTVEESREDALAKADLDTIITMEMVSQILAAQNFAMPAGYVEQDGISYMVSIGKEITTLEEMENLLLFDLGMEDIEPIYLSDVAAIMLTDNRNESYAKLNGLEGIVLSFEKQSSYATAETTNNIQDRFQELETEYEGLHFVTLMNQGDYIYLIVETILKSLFLGAVFSVLILFVFLKDIRPTFITLCSIPISVVFAIVLMYFSGVTINMISLSGLAVAVGMLVDNSVVVIENIYRLRAKGANVIQAAVSGAGQVAGAVTASTLTTVCVFLPIVFVEGITKQLFTDLALTMTYALLASLIVSLTLVPAMASGVLRKDKPVKGGRVMGGLLRGYSKTVEWALRHKAVVLILALVLLVASGILSVSKGFIFMPEMDMPNVNINVTMPEGATMEEAKELSDRVLEKIDTLDGIATVGAMMSSSESTGLQGATEVSYNVTIYITLADDKASGAAVGKQIEALCEDLPCEVSGSSAMMDMSMLSGEGVSVEIYADDMQTLQNAAEEAAIVLGNLEGVSEVSDGLEDSAPALHIDIDRNKAMQKGLTVAQIYMELAQELTNSTTAATMNLDGNSTSVIIEKAEENKLTADELEGYTFEVTGQDGTTKTFQLGDVADILEINSLNSIQRVNQRRQLTVTAALREGYNVTLVTADAERAMRNVDLGKGVSYQFTGENETIMEAVEQLLLMLVLGILLVYLVMVAQFQSLKSPFIVMFTIPLAFTGGFLALLICNMEVSVISLIGFVMLTGIIVNNGIVLVDYINQLRHEGAACREAIIEAGVTRMRPILMTTITTILGLLDMALNKAAGTALMRPVAVVCIGGLIYATLMTLFVVPCIYEILNKKELRHVRDEDLELLDI